MTYFILRHSANQLTSTIAPILLTTVIAALLIAVLGGCGENGKPNPAGVSREKGSAAQTEGMPPAPPTLSSPTGTRQILPGKCTYNHFSLETCEEDPLGESRILNWRGISPDKREFQQAPTVAETMERGLYLAGRSPAHLALRGTPVANSVRCGWRGTALTIRQRQDTLEPLLRKYEADQRRYRQSGDVHTEYYYKPDAYWSARFLGKQVEVVRPKYSETALAIFVALSHGRLNEEYLTLTCYLDLHVADYILGGGPTKITVAFDGRGDALSYGLYRMEYYDGQYGTDPLLTAGEYQATLNRYLSSQEEALQSELGNGPKVIMLSPMGDHNAIAVEAWQVIAQWDLATEEETNEQGKTVATPYAYRREVSADDPEYRKTLALLTAEITSASGTDSFAGKRVKSYSGLKAYYRDIGAYDYISPEAAKRETFTPTQPPPPYRCWGSQATGTDNTDRTLVQDCDALLRSKEALQGTGNLNWSEDLPLGEWEGVTMSEDPIRVTGLMLKDTGISGSIPPEMGRLSGLTSINLRKNGLGGDIPRELALLPDLKEIKLLGNEFNGCMPLGLTQIADSDAHLLVMQLCQLSFPAKVRVVNTTEDSVAISWEPVKGANHYLVEYRGGDQYYWRESGISKTTEAILRDLNCNIEHRFRVKAYRVSTRTGVDSQWSDESQTLRASPGECISPRFGQSHYEPEIYEDANPGAIVTHAAATDPNGDIVTHVIAEGEFKEYFDIDETTGQVTVAKRIDGTDVFRPYLTVTASDGTNIAKATILINIRWTSDCTRGPAVPAIHLENEAAHADCQALIDGRKQLEGKYHLNWSTRLLMAEWEGIILSEDGTRIIAVDLEETGLNGEIPASLGNLSALQSLNLRSNQLTGEIPRQLGSLENLETLSLAGNRLTGEIPEELGNLEMLSSLHLSGNRLTGCINPSLKEVSNSDLPTLNLVYCEPSTP